MSGRPSDRGGQPIVALRELYAWNEAELADVRTRIREAAAQANAHGKLGLLIGQAVSAEGKMLRPLLALLAAGDCGESRRDELLCTAAAGEMLHVSSLLLDDIIDGATTRRGLPSVQAEHGVPAALCAGDCLMVAAFAFLSRRGYHQSAAELMDAALTACDGEMLQDEHKFDVSIGEEVYLASIRGKTAAAFAFCCQSASRIAGLPDPVRQALTAYGETVGMMFQIRDDLRDWTLDEQTLGKPADEDFQNGVYTLPVLYAFAAEPWGTALRDFAQKRELTRNERKTVRLLVSEAGGIAYARHVLDDLAQTAFGLLATLHDDRRKNALRLLTQVLCRDS